MKELECARILRECDSFSDCKATDCPYAKYGDMCRRVLALDSAECIEKMSKTNFGMVQSIREMVREIQYLKAKIGENDDYLKG